MGAEKTQKKRDMFEFVEEGNNMYDILGKHFPYLNNDFSTTNLINTLPELASETENTQKKAGINKTYEIAFNQLANILLDTIRIKRDEESESEVIKYEEELFQKLQSAKPDANFFSSVDEYIEFAKRDLKNSRNKELRKVIIDEALSIKNPSELRTGAMLAYTDNVKEKLQKQVTSLKSIVDESEVQDEGNEDLKKLQKAEQELEEFKIIYETLNNTFSEAQYYNFLNEYTEEANKKKAEFEKSMADMKKMMICKSRREKYVYEHLFRSMSFRERAAAEEDGMLNVILGDPKSVRLPKKGTFTWKFISYESPEIILNTLTSYSGNTGNALEDQRTIAVSYGRLEYATDYRADTGKPTYMSKNLELIGVTRVGVEKCKEYFIFTEFDDLKLEPSEKIKPDNSNILAKLNVDVEKSKPEFLVQTDRIPEKQKDFYANVFFSDVYLNVINNEYDGYAGTVIDNSGKPKIVSEYLKPYHNITAVKYATSYEGKCGNGKVTAETLRTKTYKEKQREIVRKIFDNLRNQEPKKEESFQEGQGDYR